MTEPHPPVCRLADQGDSAPLTEERIAQIAKGLAHPARVAILEQFLECRPHIAQEIVDQFDLAQSTISEHLRILREAKLLDATPDGPRTWYCMRRGVLRQFAEAVLELTDTSALVDSP